MEIIEIILAILISATTGAIAALIAPWAKWGVEKRKEKLKWRKGFINECKRIIGGYDFNPDLFRETSHYFSIKHYLSDSLQKEIEKKRYTPGILPTREQKDEMIIAEFRIKKRLFHEISFLEKKWGLL